MSEVRDTAEDEARQVARGRRWYTPFAVIGSVATLVWAVAGLVIAVALLVWIFG